jgi:endonuclease/exonuclease/phosphatase family metal-dependent hydrolase
MTFVAPENTECNPEEAAEQGPLRIVSFNMHAAQSSSLQEVISLLQKLEPDIVALQEVDRETERSGFIDQAAEIAAALEMEYAYAATRFEGTGDYGIALLSSLPFSDTSRIELPDNFSWEPRVALKGTICGAAGPVSLFNLHADVWPWSSSSQIQYLSALVEDASSKRAIVLGDFNATIEQGGIAAFHTGAWFDVMTNLADAPTFMGMPFPRRIDHIFTTPTLAAAVREAGVYRSAVSDHFPIWMDMEFPVQERK